MKIGIVGYGNLGKAVEEYCLKTPSIELIGIYSRRSVKTLSGNTLPFEDVLKPLDVDTLILCGGSATTLDLDAEMISHHNNIIDAYDNHREMEEHIQGVKESISKEGIAILACGWDPGMFSVIRALSNCLPYSQTMTAWGKGVSQGHTQAIKSMEGVFDGIQFTIPIKRRLKRFLKEGETVDSKHLHKRVCYIVCKKEDKKSIVKQIIEMPNYFSGYKTIVKRVSKHKLERLKNYGHGGRVISKNSISRMDFKMNTISNPMLTAGILIKIAFVLEKLKNEGVKGVFTMLDIPPRYYVDNNPLDIL